jgi:transposase
VSPSSEPESAATKQRVAALEEELAAARLQITTLAREHEKLRAAYQRNLEQLQLLQRRLFMAKAERPVAPEEQLSFDALIAEVARLEKALEAQEKAAETEAQGGHGTKPPGGKPDKAPKPRRKLEETDLEVVRVEILDPQLEGVAQRIGFDETSRLAYQRGGQRRLVIATATYKQVVPAAADASPQPDGQPAAPTVTFPRAPLPRELLGRGLLAPSMIAHLLVSKYVMGVPFYRLESQMAFDTVSLERSTMCRYAENAGATLGAIVEAARAEAMATALCLSTDATGVAVQPARLDEKTPRPCKKGHFFVVLADRDHVFFEYQEKHTSAAVCGMFKGFSGYIQADAHVIYDALFRGTKLGPGDTGPPTEVGCWSHARRHFWEAAVCKHPLGIEGMRRIDGIFAAEAHLGKLPPSRRHQLRQMHVRPLVEGFFDWAELQQQVPRERGLVAAALGYAIRQRGPLERFLTHGQLRLDNNASERALRHIAIGRKNWLFFGSDDHAQAAGNLFSLVASCKLHGLDPEAYLSEVITVMPYWPRGRYLELSPKYWSRTRGRLDERELAREVSPITVPEALPPEEQSLPG